jgi:CDP-6-deoxy-D-xylo-4-hexulose-3-dehydrase
MNPESLRGEIADLVREYHAAAFGPRPFVPGQTSVPCAGRVFDAEELVAAVHAGLDFWLTAGRFVDRFERQLADWFGLRFALTCNSGSSANLLAVSALTSPLLGERRLVPGDEVITVAAGFPTTVNPIVQNGLIPVFLDIVIPIYNVDVRLLDAALSPRTRAVVLAHTLGVPYDLGAVSAFCRKHDLFLVEDCCDALGATWDGRHVGRFGDLATASFYPAHHVTTGEGGAVLTERPLFERIIASLRDWGRDCWCPPGHDNTCGKRFGHQLGTLPPGYDHKYTYSHVGYNLKMTDLQAAVGTAQMEKLPAFVSARRANFEALRRGLADLEEFFVLPEAHPLAGPSWFGFPLTVRPSAPFTRDETVRFLEGRKIATRLLFAGNITRQPAYRGVRFRTIGELSQTEVAMRNTFWVGVYPGLTPSMIDFMIQSFHDLARGAQ